jgi:hypothetical protein
MTEEDDYAEEYSESDGMKSESEKMAGGHMRADHGCKDYDDYGGKHQGGSSRSEYNKGNWHRWDGSEANADDEDDY